MVVTIDRSIVDKVSKTFHFNVDKFPLQGPDGMQTPWYALFRSDTGKVVGNGSVTSRYVPHQTDDVMALVEASAEAFDGIADVQCNFDHGHYVSITPSKQQRLNVFGTVDNVFPRVFIRAGYDGQAFRASLGWWRDMCRNMHIMRSVKETNVTIRHTSGLRHAMDELIATFNTLKESWGTVTTVIQHMENKRVDMVSFLTKVYGEPKDTGRELTIHQNRTRDIFNRLNNERLRSGRGGFATDNFEVSAWEAFNAIQGYVQHEATRKRVSGVDLNPFGRICASISDPYVRVAEELALAS